MVEPRRGCGFRKIGGLYLVGGGIGVPCDRLPLALCTCPVCGQGIKQTRGWTWVDIGKLVAGPHFINEVGPFPGLPCNCGIEFLPYLPCKFCFAPESMGRAGLLWIGEKFYATPADFIAEGMNLGFSRRIKSIPRGFKVGETWVLLAHPKAVPSFPENDKEALSLIQDNKGEYKPGVFYVWLPTRIEKILPESARGSEEAADLEKRGVTPVFVPDSDPDHLGSVHDDPESEQLCLEETT